MRWLIPEDSLQSRKGHWFEYILTFHRELLRLGDETVVLVDRHAEGFITDQLDAKAVLPDSIYLRMSDGAHVVTRWFRVPIHAWQTQRALKSWFSTNGPFDVVFVPTVLVHHLLGWVWLIRRLPQLRQGKTILFFPNAPVRLNSADDQPEWQPAPTAKLFCRLIRSVRKEVAEGRVVLGVETQPMRQALTQLTGVPFTYFPHVVAPLPLVADWKPRPGGIVFGSYGGARHEKGSDCLIAAVDEFCRRHPDSQVRFVLQCVEGPKEQWERLRENPKVQLIPHYFADGEYAKHLQATDALLLPYRRSSYALRVSRVVIEALVNGIPVVATRGTTLASQAEEFGGAVLCEDENAKSLVNAMTEMEQRFHELRKLAEERKAAAQRHFSVQNFRETLLAAFPNDRPSLGNSLTELFLPHDHAC